MWYKFLLKTFRIVCHFRFSKKVNFDRMAHTRLYCTNVEKWTSYGCLVCLQDRFFFSLKNYLFGRNISSKRGYWSVDRWVWHLPEGIKVPIPLSLHAWLNYEHDTIAFPTFSTLEDHRRADDFLGSSVEKETYNLEKFQSAVVAREPLSKLNSEGQLRSRFASLLGDGV